MGKVISKISTCSQEKGNSSIDTGVGGRGHGKRSRPNGQRKTSLQEFLAFFAQLTTRALIVLCSEVCVQGCLCSNLPWKIEIVSSFRAKDKFACCWVK